jgi:putative photosynthetic complex assembly protein 2
MPSVVWPLLFTVLVWWVSTGLILYLDGLPRRTFKYTLAGATALAALGFFGLVASSSQTTVASAYCAFSSAMLIWAWQEVAFLLGWVTGPRRTPCPPGLRGWARARAALQTVLHHELLLLVLAGGVLAATWGQPNQTGWWTFAVLWAMRQSAKLNVFLGVRNLSESFLPLHLKYLGTYFTRKAMNPLLPVSVAVASFVAVRAWQAAAADGATAFDITALALAASLLTLAIVEHLFMVLPVPSEALWNWGMRSRAVAETPGTPKRVD